MSKQTRTYIKDPKSVVVIIGNQSIEGFMADRIAEVTTNSDNFTYVSGAQGDVIFEKDPDKTGRIIIDLHEKSPSNKYLQSLADRQDEGNQGDILDVIGAFTGGNGAGFLVDCFVNDEQGEVVISGLKCVVSKLPSLGFGRKTQGRTWELLASEVTAKF